MRTIRFLLVVAAMGVAVPVLATADDCLLVDLDASPEARRLSQSPRASVVLELENRLLVCSGPDELADIVYGAEVDSSYGSFELGHLHLIRGRMKAEALGEEVRVVARGGRFLLVEGPLRAEMVEPGVGAAILELPDRAVLARRMPPGAGKRASDPAIQTLVDEVDSSRWFDDVVMLASWNRQTFGAGNLAARDWIAQQLTDLGTTVTTPAFSFWGDTTYNVVGTAVGSTRPDDWYLIGGHFDSMPSSGAAPGAEDNASGCAGVLEMARIFTAHPHEGTLIFICYSGEEQGLWGSEDHAGDLVAAGDGPKVKGMVNMDMIGYDEDGLDVLLEGSSEFQWIIDAFEGAAATYVPQLATVTTTNYWGSDHVPYLDRHMPALLTIENDWDDYPCYHQSCDVPANLSLDMGGAILEMNVAAMAQLAGVSIGSEIIRENIVEIIDAVGDDAGNNLYWPTGIAEDGSGNVYVVGYSSDNAFKVTSGGVITKIIDWTGDGAGNTLDTPIGTAVDGQGNVYVTGGGSDNCFKITPGGVTTEVIDAAGDGGGNALDYAFAVAVDGSGNAYVTGSGSDNVFKITPGGVATEIIDATGDGGGNTLDYPDAIAVDSSGNVYVAGGDSDNCFKITPGGVITEIIDATGDGGGNILELTRAVTVDGSGNVYVTGSNSDNCFKITPEGLITEIIDATGDGGGNALDLPVGAAVDWLRNVYVTGGISDNCFKITPSGVITEIIDAMGDGGGNTLDQPFGIAVDRFLNVYLTGSVSDNAFKIQFVVFEDGFESGDTSAWSATLP